MIRDFADQEEGVLGYVCYGPPLGFCRIIVMTREEVVDQEERVLGDGDHDSDNGMMIRKVRILASVRGCVKARVRM